MLSKSMVKLQYGPTTSRPESAKHRGRTSASSIQCKSRGPAANLSINVNSARADSPNRAFGPNGYGGQRSCHAYPAAGLRAVFDHLVIRRGSPYGAIEADRNLRKRNSRGILPGMAACIEPVCATVFVDSPNIAA